MNYCEFVIHEPPNTYRCRKCGWQWTDDSNFNRTPIRWCDTSPPMPRRGSTEPPVPAGEVAFHFELCRRNTCNQYVRNRGAGGKEQELCYAKKSCRGKPIPIEMFCRSPRGCPEKHF